MKYSKLIQISSLIALITLASCGKSASTTATSSASEDTSTSGTAAVTVTSALSSSSSSGTQSLSMNKSSTFNLMDYLIPKALASTACPTFATTSTGCTTSGGNMWLTYSSCSIGSSAAVWTGVQQLSMSTGSAACGTFPNPGASATLSRQYVTAASSSYPAAATRVNAAGTAQVIDHSSTNLTNFNGDTITPIIGTGYGTVVTFNSSGLRSQINIAQRIYTTGLDHTVVSTTPLTITESSGTAATRTINGTVKVYHNKLKVVATSTFTNVVHSLTCCQPTGGSITTVYSAGGTVSPTNAGLLVVGKSETLTFTGCGTGTLTATDGTVTSVTLTSCF